MNYTSLTTSNTFPALSWFLQWFNIPPFFLAIWLSYHSLTLSLTEEHWNTWGYNWNSHPLLGLTTLWGISLYTWKRMSSNSASLVHTKCPQLSRAESLLHLSSLSKILGLIWKALRKKKRKEPRRMNRFFQMEGIRE